MAMKYGNESQFTLFAPDCGFFASHATVHYAIVVYTPVVQAFSVAVNALIIFVLIGGGESNKLLRQSQHVYVLGSAITNVLLSSIGILGFWVDQFVIPCMPKNFTLCAFKNLFQFGGGYQIVFNVCLVCYDRYRLVTLGTQYDHKREVKRAKWLLAGTSFVSAMLFLVPEITTPMITGKIFQRKGPGDYTRCLSSALQNVSFLFGYNLTDVIGILMIFGPLAFILTFTTLTAYKLFRAQSKAAASASNTSQLADSRKLIRASLVMFGMVAALLTTWGPYAIYLVMIEFNPARWFSLMTLMILIVLLDTAPALDPFVFALSLPKLRARARRTTIGRIATSLLALRITITVIATSKNETLSTVAGTKSMNSTIGVGSRATVRTQHVRSANKVGLVVAPRTNQAEGLAEVTSTIM